MAFILHGHCRVSDESVLRLFVNSVIESGYRTQRRVRWGVTMEWNHGWSDMSKPYGWYWASVEILELYTQFTTACSMPKAVTPWGGYPFIMPSNHDLLSTMIFTWVLEWWERNYGSPYRSKGNNSKLKIQNPKSQFKI